MKAIFTRIAMAAAALVAFSTSSVLTSCSGVYADNEEIEALSGRSTVAPASETSAVSIDGQQYYMAASGNKCEAGENGTFEMTFECYSIKSMAAAGWCYKDKTASKYEVRMMVAGFDAESADYGQKLDVVGKGTLVSYYSNAEGKTHYFVFEDFQPEGSVTFVSLEDGMLTVNLSGVRVVCQNVNTGVILDERTISGPVTMAYAAK